MRFRVHPRAKVCGPDIMFEELEQRIVLDASVDSIAVGSHAGGPDLLHGLLPGLDQEGPAVHANAPQAGDWRLEYSSDPASQMVQVLDHDDLALIDVELGTPVPGIQLYAVPPVQDDDSGADLSGAIRVTGDPTQTLTMTLTPNPRPLNSAGINSLSTSSISGKVDEVNATLATLYATIYDCFNGFAEIDISLYDEDHATSSDDSPMVVKTLYIPVDRTPHEPAASVPNPQFIPSNTWFALPVSVADKDSNELGVVVTVNHGVVNIPSASADVEGLVDPAITYYGTEGPNGRPLEQAMRVGVRGPIPNLQAALSGLQYRSFPGYYGGDQMTVTVADEGFLPKPDICRGAIVSITPITVI
jgi:hypothetical protein